MKQIKRYKKDLEVKNDTEVYPTMKEDKRGGYVRYESLENKLKILKGRLERAKFYYQEGFDIENILNMAIADCEENV